MLLAVDGGWYALKKADHFLQLSLAILTPVRNWNK